MERNVLLVEGKDDFHVFQHLTDHYGFSGSFSIEPTNGIDSLLDVFDVSLKVVDRIAIIADADDKLEARWESIKHILRDKYGFSRVPDRPTPSGTVIEEEGHPVVGVWLMPDNTVPGKLEDFIAFLVPASDVMWTLASKCLDQVPANEKRYDDKDRIKAQVHTWLAWQKQPGVPMGQAIRMHYLDANATHAQDLVHWVQRVFPLPADPKSA